MTVTLLDTTEARRLTDRIRRDLDRVASGWADMAEHVAEAYDRRADLALGYDSWEAYAAAELKPSEGIAAEVRRELVALLSARGMSTRAIAPAINTPRETVRRWAGEVTQVGSPDAERIDPTTGEIVPAPTFGAVDVTDWTNDEITEDLEACEAETAHWEETTVPAKITGLDGKTYTRHEPVAARATPRRSLVDVARDAGQELRKATERLERIATDDRLGRNKEEVAAHLRHHLNRAIEVCQDLDNLLNITKESTRVRTS